MIMRNGYEAARPPEERSRLSPCPRLSRGVEVIVRRATEDYFAVAASRTRAQDQCGSTHLREYRT